MKKIVLGLITLFSVASHANAQSFTFAHDTARITVPSSGAFELHNDITNKLSTSQSGITWQVISHTIPSGAWFNAFGLCDNKNCYPNTVITADGMGKYPVYTMDPITANATVNFDVSYGDLSAASGSGPYFVTIEVKDGAATTVDTVTFQFNKFPTSVSNVNRSNDILMYPNPAHSELNVVFDGVPNVKNIAVYNLIGKVVSVYRVTDNNSAKLDVDNLPSGIYFLRLNDGQGRVLATRKFTHQ